MSYTNAERVRDLVRQIDGLFMNYREGFDMLWLHMGARLEAEAEQRAEDKVRRKKKEDKE